MAGVGENTQFMNAEQLQQTLAKSLTEYLAEIKALVAENETLRIQHRHAEHKIALLETKLRKAEDYNAIMAARAEALDEESQ